MTNEEILANEQDIDQKIQVKLDEFFNHASAVQVEEGTWYYQDVSVERELSDAYKTAFQMQRRIAELEQENALLLVKTLPECNCEGLQERITELEQCLVEVTNGATGQAPCAKYCEARATAIEMRKLRAENDRLYNALANFEGVDQEISALKHESNRKSQRIENVQRRKAEYKKRAEAAESELENERMISMKRFVETGRADKFAIEQQIDGVFKFCEFLDSSRFSSSIAAKESGFSKLAETFASQLRQQLNGGRVK